MRKLSSTLAPFNSKEDLLKKQGRPAEEKGYSSGDPRQNSESDHRARTQEAIIAGRPTALTPRRANESRTWENKLTGLQYRMNCIEPRTWTPIESAKLWEYVPTTAQFHSDAYSDRWSSPAGGQVRPPIQRGESLDSTNWKNSSGGIGSRGALVFRRIGTAGARR